MRVGMQRSGRDYMRTTVPDLACVVKVPGYGPRDVT
jgi:hypothetical protein